MKFLNVRQQDDRTYTFTLSGSHVTYANTLRRLILTGVETVSFRSDMTATGSTTDVIVKQNDTPMTNEMLADRIGLLPIHITKPNEWNNKKYLFTLHVKGDKDQIRHVKSEDFIVTDVSDVGPVAVGDEEKKDDIVGKRVPTEMFFPKNPITNDTCLIATLMPGTGPTQQSIHIEAMASKGTGREHARFSSVSQCSYEYTPDNDPQRIAELFSKWLTITKKVNNPDKASERYAELQREFNTMQIKRCFKVDDKGEPFSFDFTVESVGVLDVKYIVQRACEVAENICSRYVNLHDGDLPDEITLSPADARVIGFDFLFRGHDHTLGNLLQTWLVEHHIEGEAKPSITYTGYSVPHPLRDEMVLRVGVKDGKEATARAAVAAAARGCAEWFQTLRMEWGLAIGKPIGQSAETGSDQKQVRRGPRVSSARVG
jgi:DNA-directed RNA polymerase subunit L